MRTLNTHLEWLNECVEKNSDADTSPQQFYQPCCSEQLEKPDLNNLGGIDDTSHHGDKIKSVPGIFEIILKSQIFANEIHFEFILSSAYLGTKRSEFQHSLDCEEQGEEEVKMAENVHVGERSALEF